jgi:transcriptional regulator with XRE-family HTH domain
VKGCEVSATGRDDPDRKLFGNQLRKMREQRGWSRDELGDKIGHTGSTIANIETAYRAPTAEQARALDLAFGLPATFEDLEERLHGLPFSAGFRPFAPYEAEATVLKLYEPLLVPGLLQTEDYARAILSRHPDVTPELVDERAQGRLDRQSILARETPTPPRLWVIVDQSVLRREIGSRKIMESQVRHLIDTATRPGVTVQVLDETAHCGLSGAFYLAEMPSGRRVVYLETAADGTTSEDPSVVVDLELRFGVLMTEALRARESLALMERIADEWTD